MRKRLFEVEKQIGLCAILANEYILSEFFFQRCYDFDKQVGKQLLDLLKTHRNGIKEKHAAQVEKIMQKLQETPENSMLVDEYVDEILHMGSIYTIHSLLPYIASDYQWQRIVAAESLGKLGNSSSIYNGKNVVKHLITALEKHRYNATTQEKQVFIWTFGRLRATEALNLVKDIRNQEGPKSPLYKNTAIPYSWLLEKSN